MSDFQQTYDRIIRPIEDRMVRSIWRIVRNPQDAADVMQDVLLIILKRWNRICGHANPQSLVLKICIDVAYDLTRQTFRNRPAALLDKGEGEPVGSMRTPAEEVMAGEQYAEIMLAIHRLPRQQATSILMRAVQGQTYEAIAAALGCREATARKHVARARARLRIWLAHLNPRNVGIGGL
jgi:RNA polymerase sigma-70 factor (ECF subfamily)